MTEGQLKKLCVDYRKRLCIHAPEENENGEITQEIHDSYSRPFPEEIEQAIDEAKKDFPTIEEGYFNVLKFIDLIEDWFEKWFGE